MKIIFLAYRPWAKKVLPTVKSHPNVESVEMVEDLASAYELALKISGKTPYLDAQNKKYINDEKVLILLCGWSVWDNDNTARQLVNVFPDQIFGVHCAEHDKYSGGTPLQNQIIDGMSYTKHRLFKVGYPELSLRQYTHEVDLDLSGHIKDIFEQLTATSKILFNKFLDTYPNHSLIEWKRASEHKPGLKPNSSHMTKDEIAKLSTEDLYNMIRCREDPYPNVYMEDGVGTLYFEKVRFKRKR